MYEREQAYQLFRKGIEEAAAELNMNVYDIVTEEEIQEGFAEDWAKYLCERE